MSAAAERKSQQFTEENPFRIYMGFDSHEEIAFQVASHSLSKRTKVPHVIYPLKQKEMRDKGLYYRQRDPKQSTEFTYLRFLVPQLAGYKGWAMFVDDDFLWLGDIADLLDQIDDKYAIMCVKHDYKPTEATKLAGVAQDAYPRKNWSSMVLYNCGHPANQKLTVELANKETGSYLHRFMWIEDDSLIGEVPYTWNFLVGWYKKLEGDKVPGAIHYTEGGPWFPDHRAIGVDYQKEWFEELKEFEATLPEKRKLCPFERFSQNGSPFLPGYPNSEDKWEWEVVKE
eukprot:TRINITY_DN261_c1_g1_i1.p1 TRINITY_DN261_c1_g1~~TRINITY_DN261_c1_g1_i1.p1  ORF type:complete len:285 (-),score=138.65 TRINITY_DN261_c1_g1_i1:79-933(-)